MLRIAVCAKQVPAVSDGGMDQDTGIMIRTGKSITNIYDLSAVEAALYLKEAVNGKAQVDVFTMGPQKAEAVLRECYSLGADNGFLLCDPAFSGADVLATSFTLANGIRAAGGYDIIFCGRQTTDGDTGQVGGAIAQWLNIPHLTGVTAVTAVTSGCLTAEQAVNGMVQTAQVPSPCLLAVDRESFLPRMPVLRLKLAAAKKEIQKLSAADLPPQETTYYGLSGSATRVKQVFSPPAVPHQRLRYAHTEAEQNELAQELLRLSREAGQ